MTASDKRLREAVEYMFYTDMQVMTAVCKLWGRHPDEPLPAMPKWAIMRVETIMREDGIPGEWPDGFAVFSNQGGELQEYTHEATVHVNEPTPFSCWCSVVEIEHERN
jgi:hypothetical protein